MRTQNRKYTFRDFLADDGFVRIARLAEQGDRRELDALLQAHPQAAREIRTACVLLRSVRPAGPGPSRERIARSLDEVRRRALRNRRFRVFCRWSAVAAAVLLVGLTGYYVSLEQDRAFERQIAASLRSGSIPSDSIVVAVGDREVCKLGDARATVGQDERGLVVNERQRIRSEQLRSEMIRVSVPYGKRTVVDLVDGTRVWVGPGSKLIYPARFGSGKRELYADGEAYFEVAHDARRPFVVTTEKLQVRVLGTQFNLSSGYGSDRAEVVLVEGRVRVHSASGRTEELLPDQRYLESAAGAVVDTVDTESFTAWKEGYLLLGRSDLAALFGKIGRYYGVEIHCDEALGRRTCDGKLELCDRVEEVLRNLAMVEPFDIECTQSEKPVYLLTAKTLSPM